MASDEEEFSSIAEWFERRRFGIKFSKDESGTTWVDLVSLSSGRVIAKYGRGSGEIEAARRAKQRWLAEEE